MNVISRKKLKAFYESKSGHRQHASAFEGWFKLSRKAKWKSFQDAKSTFGQADVAKDTATGKTATIFDIGGNKYRVITLVDYTRQIILITHVMTHSEYGKMKWKSGI